MWTVFSRQPLYSAARRRQVATHADGATADEHPGVQWNIEDAPRDRYRGLPRMQGRTADCLGNAVK